MLNYQREQNVYRIGNVTVGGQPGERGTLLIASMFHNKDKILEKRKGGLFDRERAKAYLERQDELSRLTGVAAMTAMVSNSGEEFAQYLDFYLETTDAPFACDVWMAKKRLECARVVAKLNLQDKFLYNSITPWDKEPSLPDQVAELKDLGIKHVVIQAFDESDKRGTGRVRSLDALFEEVAKGEFQSILVDTSSMSLPTTPFCYEGNRLIKEKYGFPCGQATSNGTYMYRKDMEVNFPDGFPAVDASVEGISALFSDFMFYGPAVGANRVFLSVAMADLLAASWRYDRNVAPLPQDPNHPLNRMFPKFVAEMEGAEGGEPKIEEAHS